MNQKTKNPKKQRKKLYNAPYHKRKNFISVHLNKKLKKMYNSQSIAVRKGDSVKIMRGDFKGLEGKVIKVDRKECKLDIEGAVKEKVDGNKINIPIHSSKVEITKLNLDDKWRKEILKRRGFIEVLDKEGNEKVIVKPNSLKEEISEKGAK